MMSKPKMRLMEKVEKRAKKAAQRAAKEAKRAAKWEGMCFTQPRPYPLPKPKLKPRVKKPRSKPLRAYLAKLMGEEGTPEKEALAQLHAALEGLHDARDTLEKHAALQAYLRSPHIVPAAARAVEEKLVQLAPRVQEKERERIRAERHAAWKVEWEKRCADNQARAQGLLPPDPEEQRRAREREERAGMRIALSYGE